MKKQLHVGRSDATKSLMLVLIVLLTAFPVLAMASTGGGGADPFSTSVDTLVGWLKGGLGLLLSLTALGVGLIAGLRAGSIWGFAVGVGFALVCYYGPDVLTSVFGATLA